MKKIANIWDLFPKATGKNEITFEGKNMSPVIFREKIRRFRDLQVPARFEETGDGMAVEIDHEEIRRHMTACAYFEMGILAGLQHLERARLDLKKAREVYSIAGTMDKDFENL